MRGGGRFAEEGKLRGGSNRGEGVMCSSSLNDLTLLALVDNNLVEGLGNGGSSLGLGGSGGRPLVVTNARVANRLVLHESSNRLATIVVTTVSMKGEEQGEGKGSSP